MVKPSRREIALVAVALLLLGVWLSRSGTPLAPASGSPSQALGSVEEVARIGLERLKQGGGPAAAGPRDPFGFGAAPQRAPERASATAQPPPSMAMHSPAPEPVTAVAAGPAVVPLNVKYVGSVESKQGVRVAVLLTDKKEILVGQQGDVVANRLRIVKIGYESVDVQDMGSEHVRRIPFKGN
jgi:hypothetical protein